jgi:hypothetical protein
MRRTYDEIRRNEPSRFLADIPAECLSVRARAPARRPQMAPRDHDEYQDYEAPPEYQDVGGGDDEPVYYLDEEGDDDPYFPRGALVRHKIFGVGEIEEGSGRGPSRKLRIRFPSHGLKTIDARWVERVPG